MEENKYSEIIKGYTFEQLVYERAILDKEKDNVYIKDKELKEEFKEDWAEKNKMDYLDLLDIQKGENYGD